MKSCISCNLCSNSNLDGGWVTDRRDLFLYYVSIYISGHLFLYYVSIYISGHMTDSRQITMATWIRTVAARHTLVNRKSSTSWERVSLTTRFKVSDVKVLHWICRMFVCPWLSLLHVWLSMIEISTPMAAHDWIFHLFGCPWLNLLHPWLPIIELVSCLAMISLGRPTCLAAHDWTLLGKIHWPCVNVS